MNEEITEKMLETLQELLEELRGLDEVAYVRFASVYRQFKDVNTFLDELQKLLAERKD